MTTVAQEQGARIDSVDVSAYPVPTSTGILKEADPLVPQKAWSEMQMPIRQMGHAGIAAMAVSAIDVALWDLSSRPT